MDSEEQTKLLHNIQLFFFSSIKRAEYFELIDSCKSPLKEKLKKLPTANEVDLFLNEKHLNQWNIQKRSYYYGPKFRKEFFEMLNVKFFEIAYDVYESVKDCPPEDIEPIFYKKMSFYASKHCNFGRSLQIALTLTFIYFNEYFLIASDNSLNTSIKKKLVLNSFDSTSPAESTPPQNSLTSMDHAIGNLLSESTPEEMKNKNSVLRENMVETPMPKNVLEKSNFKFPEIKKCIDSRRGEVKDVSSAKFVQQKDISTTFSKNDKETLRCKESEVKENSSLNNDKSDLPGENTNWPSGQLLQAISDMMDKKIVRFYEEYRK